MNTTRPPQILSLSPQQTLYVGTKFCTATLDQSAQGSEHECTGQPRAEGCKWRFTVLYLYCTHKYWYTATWTVSFIVTTGIYFSRCIWVNINCISLPSKVLIFCRLHFILENCSKYFGKRKSFGTLPALTSTLHAIKIKLYIVSSESAHFTKNLSWCKIQTLLRTPSCYNIRYSRAVDADGIQTWIANSSKELIV
jgi:hypothetical protein